MARPQRNNADYFSHDANFRNDPKIRAVRGRFGCAGYGVVSMLLEMLTASDGFSLHWDDIMVELYAGDVGVSASEIQEIVSFCVRIQFFTIENAFLTCEVLSASFRPLVEKRQFMRQKQQGKTKTTGVSDAETPPESDNGEVPEAENPHSIVKHSIVKHSKGKERRESEEHTRSPARASPEVELAQLQATAAMSGVPPDFTERLWNHYEATKRMDGSWIDSNGHTISNPAKKIVALWQTERAKPNGNSISNAANGIRPQPGKYGDL